ncbi:hypothetical protein [Tissierella creatinophila]|uniref:Uncharacterized protein n=1 Tax=Tissierella creatinophila DSM 6911 TaxID=1123403 RepID=A0A1U7M908_TISCR|nr:hypothetical protein [Tissierella creatinophila]OLS03787.1 hypothetical protein TICRE_01100 [Tissierella creatinophila DSM 6911]
MLTSYDNQFLNQGFTYIKRRRGINILKQVVHIGTTVTGIYKIYASLKENGVEFISDSQYFDLTYQGFGEIKAVYFKD